MHAIWTQVCVYLAYAYDWNAIFQSNILDWTFSVFYFYAVLKWIFKSRAFTRNILYANLSHSRRYDAHKLNNLCLLCDFFSFAFCVAAIGQQCMDWLVHFNCFQRIISTYISISVFQTFWNEFHFRTELKWLQHNHSQQQGIQTVFFPIVAFLEKWNRSRFYRTNKSELIFSNQQFFAFIFCDFICAMQT